MAWAQTDEGCGPSRGGWRASAMPATLTTPTPAMSRWGICRAPAAVRFRAGDPDWVKLSSARGPDHAGRRERRPDDGVPGTTRLGQVNISRPATCSTSSRWSVIPKRRVQDAIDTSSAIGPSGQRRHRLARPSRRCCHDEVGGHVSICSTSTATERRSRLVRCDVRISWPEARTAGRGTLGRPHSLDDLGLAGPGAGLCPADPCGRGYQARLLPESSIKNKGVLPVLRRAPRTPT